MAGVILLALWAIAMATDYSTGLIRILVQAQPNRVKLMAGKILALTVFTLLAATVTALVVILLARPLARLEGIQVEAWKTDFPSHLVKGYFDFTLAVLVYGLIGLMLAVLTRSSALAIGIGIGALLVVEGLITHRRPRRQLLPTRRHPEHPRRGRKPPTLLGSRARTGPPLRRRSPRPSRCSCSARATSPPESGPQVRAMIEGSPDGFLDRVPDRESRIHVDLRNFRKREWLPAQEAALAP